MWLAASACPDDSSMLGILLAICSMEELIGRVYGGLWLAASACPYGSSMLRLLRVFFVRRTQRFFRKGCVLDQCAANSIKSNQIRW